MTEIDRIIDRIQELFADKLTISIQTDRRKRGDFTSSLIDSIALEIVELIRANEPALREELVSEIARVREMSTLERADAYMEGARMVVAIAITQLEN